MICPWISLNNFHYKSTHKLHTHIDVWKNITIIERVMRLLSNKIYRDLTVMNHAYATALKKFSVLNTLFSMPLISCKEKRAWLFVNLSNCILRGFTGNSSTYVGRSTYLILSGSQYAWLCVCVRERERERAKCRKTFVQGEPILCCSFFIQTPFLLHNQRSNPFS